MKKFKLNYYGGYKIKMDDLVINIYAPKHISGQFLTPQISENIIGYLIEEGFLDDIENNSNINVITHEA